MQTSRLSIVDLAGSERTKNTGNTGSLHFMGLFIVRLFLSFLLI